MAARAAHTTSSLLSKPSIFEVIAQESLADDVRPAYNRVIKFLSTCNPERYGWVDYWCRSKSHSLLLRLINVSLIYRNDREHKTIRELWKSAWKDRSNFPNISAELLIRTVTFAMETGAFFLQCLNWYHSNQNEQTINVLPTPKPPKNHDSDVSSKVCPICHKKRKIETALITSGEVFCFKCIILAVNETGKCPVTGIPSTINDLIRIYHQ
ncbi:peroxisome assembly protein 12-B-like [Lycorma delicatula]|uniref:peroxisome assembly protein 12-B-like n=1 Tax=Lycorma delicatula TaxID=130591 RepID=UPI003F51A1AE